MCSYTSSTKFTGAQWTNFSLQTGLRSKIMIAPAPGTIWITLTLDITVEFVWWVGWMGSQSYLHIKPYCVRGEGCLVDVSGWLH